MKDIYYTQMYARTNHYLNAALEWGRDDLLVINYDRVKLIFNKFISIILRVQMKEWLIWAWEIREDLPAALTFVFSNEEWIF